MAKQRKKQSGGTDSLLLAGTAEVVELVNYTGPARVQTSSYGLVDLSTLTPRRALILVRRGFPFLQLKEQENPFEETNTEK